MDFRRLDFQKVAAITNRNFFAGEMTSAVNRRVRLRDKVVFFLIASQIVDIIRDTAVRDFAIRCFNETKLVYARESRHRADQTDVWSLRRLDRTNSAVVRRMHVAHFESGAIATQSAWSERGQPALVR